MKRNSVLALILAVLTMVLLPCAFAQAPVVQAVINAASGDSTTLARGSFVSIFGLNLGTKAGPPSSLPLPTSLGGASVTFKPAGGSASFQGFMHFVSQNQINAIVPSAVPAGPTDVTVTVNNVTSTSRRIQVAENAFGIFTVTSQVAGNAVAQNYESPTSLPLNLYTNPARPGQTLILYGTGLGAYTAGPDNAAPQAGNIVNNAQVIVAGYKITPAYAGRAPGFPGVDQVNFTLPADMPIPDGCTLVVQVQIGSLVQNGQATIAKSSNAPVCDHPFALTPDQLSLLQFGTTLKAGVVRVLRSHGVQAYINGSPLGGLSETIEVHIRKLTTSANLSSQTFPFALSQAPGTCSTMKVPGSQLDFNGHIDTAGSQSTDFGSTLTLTGPGTSVPVDPEGTTKLVDGPEIPGAVFTNSVLVDGNWTLSAPGGKDIGAFQASFTLQNQFKLQNVPQTASKGQPLTVSWSGGADNDPVRILVAGATLSDTTTAVICTALAGAHSFTISGDFTSQLTTEASTGNQGLLAAYYAGAPVSFSAQNLDSGKIAVGVVEGFTGLTIR